MTPMKPHDLKPLRSKSASKTTPRHQIACALHQPPRSALGMSLHAVTLMIHQRLSLDVEKYADVVDLRVVPPLCPISVAPTDFSQADDLIGRAYRHTTDWLFSPAALSARPNLPTHHEHLPARRATSF